MFMRIGIISDDRDAQRFLWRGRNRTCEPSEFRMRVLLFGAKSSPSTAIFIRDKNARQFADRFPSASFYQKRSVWLLLCITRPRAGSSPHLIRITPTSLTNRLATTQIELINVITDLCATIQSTEHDDWTRGRVQARQELLQGYWEDFMSNHLELMERDNDDPSYDRASNYALVQG
ncbi:unnamed protein product, partial [Trichogramma brassicae]